MATTLFELAQDKQSRSSALVSSTQTAFAQATRDLNDAQADYSNLTDNVAELEQAVADKRTAMSDPANMPADIEALAGELRELLIEQRAGAANLLAAEADVAGAQRSKDQLERRLTGYQAALAAAIDELAAAEQVEADHIAWKSVETTAALGALAAAAQASLDGAPGSEALSSAEARIVSDIPAVLLTRARQRGQNLLAADAGVAALLRSHEDALADQLEADGGVEGVASKHWLAYVRSESAFKDFVFTSQARFDQAQALVGLVNSSVELTAAEQARIADVAIAGDDDALVNEKAVDDIAAAIAAKTVELEQAIAAAVIANIDTDPSLDGDVQARQGELDSLTSDLAAAEAAFTDPQRRALDLWEAAVPDSIWSNLTGYDTAVTLLNGIAGGDPPALAAALDAAELALVTALEANDGAGRISRRLEDSIEQVSGEKEYLTNSRQQRLLGALRGDV